MERGSIFYSNVFVKPLTEKHFNKKEVRNVFDGHLRHQPTSAILRYIQPWNKSHWFTDLTEINPTDCFIDLLIDQSVLLTQASQACDSTRPVVRRKAQAM